MKKIKNTELKESDTTLKRTKEGKIKKKKQKKEKVTVHETEDLKLVPEKEAANLKDNLAGNDRKPKKDKKKNKRSKEEKNPIQETKAELSKEANSTGNETNNKSEHQVVNDHETVPKKHKKKKDKQKTREENTASEEKPANELKKIEKKKAKKLAKLKKQKQQRDANKTTAPTASKDSNETKLPISNDEKKTKTKKLDSAADKNLEASKKVLSKKEKKAEKRQLIKDQKLAETKPRDPAIEAATVFVGNLPVNTKRPQLINIFKKFGPINFIRFRSAGGQILFKHKQRKAAGALNAYVVLETKEKAEKALSLNGVEFKGNHLRVTLATKKSHIEETDEAKRTVFIGNLKYSASEESLREIFSSCGEIDYVRCIRDGDKGCKGVAYVCFKTADAVGLALELNQTIVDERPINVERYSVKKLGAKKSREAQEEKENKSKSGAKKRIDGKKGKKEKFGKKVKNTGEDDDTKKSKKSEFRGVKVDGIKKKQKPKKKKSKDQMLQLAKKIAPKPKN